MSGGECVVGTHVVLPPGPGVYSSIPDQVKVNTVATAASGGAGLDESYYATPKSTMEQVRERERERETSCFLTH